MFSNNFFFKYNKIQSDNNKKYHNENVFLKVQAKHHKNEAVKNHNTIYFCYKTVTPTFVTKQKF